MLVNTNSEDALKVLVSVLPFIVDRSLFWCCLPIIKRYGVVYLFISLLLYAIGNEMRNSLLFKAVAFLRNGGKGTRGSTEKFGEKRNHQASPTRRK